MTGNKAILHSIKHLLIGMALTLKGIDKVSRHLFIGSIILGFGIIILSYFIYLLVKKHPAEKLDLLVHWCEGIACLFTAYIFFREGAKYLQYAFLLAAAGFFFSIYMHYRKKSH